MALQPIPEQWRKEVCALLKASVDWTIRPTKGFGEEFQKSFPQSFIEDVYEAYISFLEGGSPMGCPVPMDYPAGATWDFYFTFEGKKTYGKIMLRNDHKRIIPYSAHLPKKPKLRCE